MLVLLCFAHLGFAQRVRIVASPGPVPVDEPFTLSVELTDMPLEDMGPFPELPGFKKLTRGKQTETRIVGASTTVVETITQQYVAFGEGEKTIAPFSLMVNGDLVRFPRRQSALYGGGHCCIAQRRPAWRLRGGG